MRWRWFWCESVWNLDGWILWIWQDSLGVFSYLFSQCVCACVCAYVRVSWSFSWIENPCCLQVIQLRLMEFLIFHILHFHWTNERLARPAKSALYRMYIWKLACKLDAVQKLHERLRVQWNHPFPSRNNSTEWIELINKMIGCPPTRLWTDLRLLPFHSTN